ncbi:MAG: metallophosphoesterase [Bacilli bacterium]|nr:metallophosphoesterase [Bacilli bacterium]
MSVTIFSILFIIVLMFYYLYKIFSKLKPLSKIKNKLLRIIVIILPFIVLFVLFGIVNAIVIIFHLFIFTIIVNVLFLIFKKKDNNDLVVLIGAIITCIYLGIGVYLNYHVFETKYVINTNKDIGVEKIRIIQISDAHVGTTFDGNGFSKHIDKINKIDSDIFVITGDFIDDNTSYEDMKKSCEALSKIKSKYGVYYVNGNHDRGYFNSRNYSYNEFIHELEINNVTVLMDEVKEINDYIYLIGREDKQVSGRKSIDDLTKDLDKSKYMIVLNHQPNDYKNESEVNVDLVLSGHSHGGQMFPLGYVGVLIGANDSFYGYKKINNTNFIVNSGISDWEIDFKTGTHSEYVIIDIVKDQKEDL